MVTAFVAFRDCFVIPSLHVVDVGLSDELIQQSVSLLVVNLVLNGDQRILEVHDRIL